jgi:hypothetical protein
MNHDITENSALVPLCPRLHGIIRVSHFTQPDAGALRVLLPYKLQPILIYFHLHTSKIHALRGRSFIFFKSSGVFLTEEVI